jgi:hypothetical protein
MCRVFGVAVLLCGVAGCAGKTTFHGGPTGLSPREQRALVAASRVRPEGFDRFWLRRSCPFGLVKWSEERSRSVEGSPAGVLDLIRDEVGRVNRGNVLGETVYVNVVVYMWRERWFGRGARVGYEIVGRDRAGQIIWLGEDRVSVVREKAANLAEGDEVLLAREVGRKLSAELGR